MPAENISSAFFINTSVCTYLLFSRYSFIFLLYWRLCTFNTYWLLFKFADFDDILCESYEGDTSIYWRLFYLVIFRSPLNQPTSILIALQALTGLQNMSLTIRWQTVLNIVKPCRLFIANRRKIFHFTNICVDWHPHGILLQPNLDNPNHVGDMQGVWVIKKF